MENMIVRAVRTWARGVRWADLALVLVYGLLRAWKARNAGDVLGAFAAYLVLRFIVGKYPKKA